MNTKPHKSTTHDERYFHLRDYDGIDSNATIFFRENDGKWEASVAYCHPNDNFSRKLGRTTARRKFFAGKKYLVDAPTVKEAYNVLVMGTPNHE